VRRLPEAGWAYPLALAALTAGALALRLVFLPGQPLIPDDLSVRDSALNFLHAGWPGPTMWNHPRLRDLLVAGSLRLLGDGPLGIKAWSVVLGTLSVPATAWLVTAAGGARAAALLAALLVGSDPLHLDFSRQGINDVYLACLGPAAVAAAWSYRRGRRPGWLLASGVLLGLGLASKHAVAFPAAVVALLLLAEALRTPAPAGARAAEVAFGVAALAVLPAAIYLATFLPWFTAGHDLAEWWRFQATAARETATHVGYPGTKLPGYLDELVGAWRWFVQPAWYVDQTMVGSVEEGTLGFAFVVGVANPLAWLVTWPAALHAAWRWRAAGDRTAGLLLALFLAAYLPFALAPRPIWANSSLTVLPFAAALTGLAAARLGRRWRWPIGGWLAATVLCAALLWPPAAGLTTRPSAWLVEALVPEVALTPRPDLTPPGGGHP
jgi:4-amino-4-deoxy-L-arabinose transferase-like glycosyltransferase